jgi:hypothetical protein
MKTTSINPPLLKAMPHKVDKKLQIIKRKRQKKYSYEKLCYQYPRLVNFLLNDLLEIDGYSEKEIAFATGLHIDTIQKILHYQFKNIPQRVFFDIVGLYARVFCIWSHFNDSEP